MNAPLGRCRVFITVTAPGSSTVEYQSWTGRSVRAIQRAAKARHPGCRLVFGRAAWRNSEAKHDS